MNINELSALHKSLSVPARLEILRLVADRPLCVNAITRFLGISQPAVSQHLAVLRHAGLVRGEKNGYTVYYSLNRARLREFRDAVESIPGTAPGPDVGRSRHDGKGAEPAKRREEPHVLHEQP